MRRTLIVALTVLVLSVALCAAGSTAVCGTVKRADALRQQAAEAMRQSDATAAAQAVRSMRRLWLGQGRVLEMLTAHDSLSEVQGGIEDALLCLERGDRLEFLRALTEVGTALERIRIAESVRLMNLF